MPVMPAPPDKPRPEVRLSHYSNGDRRWVVVAPKGYYCPNLIEAVKYRGDVSEPAIPGRRSYGFNRNQSDTIDNVRKMYFSKEI